MAEIIEHEGRRFERTGEVRRAKKGEWYLISDSRPQLALGDHSLGSSPLCILREITTEVTTLAQFTVSLNTAQGPAYLVFSDAQAAMEEMGRANLETLRRWVSSLERRAQEKATVKS